MKGYYKQLTRVLWEYGYRPLSDRGKGSHEMWSNGKHNQTVPYNCPSRHTANDILKKCGIPGRF